MTNPYSPPGESESALWLERSNLIGGVLAGWAHGILVAVFVLTIRILLYPPKGQPLRWPLLAYSIIIFLLGTIAFAMNTRSVEQIFIDDRNFPGGPNAYTVASYDLPIGFTGNLCFVLANWMADGLLLWRTLVIWSFNYYLIAFPLLMYVASLGLGSTFIAQLAIPNESIWTKLTVSITIPYFSISLSLNIILTFLIVARLVLHKREIKKLLGGDHLSDYSSVTAMLVESTALFSAFSLVFLVSFAVNSNVQNLFLPVLGEMQIIAPLMIILRVGMGRAWSRNTGNNTGLSSDMRFASRTLPTLTTGTISDDTGADETTVENQSNSNASSSQINGENGKESV